MVARFEPQANKKFFDPAIFQKCWRGVGEQPTFAKQIKLHETSQQKSKRKSEKSQLPSKSEDCNMKQGFRGNCDSLGKLGMCPSLAEPYAIGFPKSIISVATVPPEQLQDYCLLLQRNKAGRSCSPRLEKLSLFSPPPPCAKSMAREFRCLRAAIRATRPEPRQHF